jgi:putative aldouronate transport system substrate-binding protein
LKKSLRSAWFAAALVMIMILAACTGGSGGESSNPSEDGGEGEELPHVTFTYASVQGIEGYDYTAGDDLAKYYSEKFNYTLEVTALNWDNWNDRLRIWINSGDMPDVAVYNYIHADAASFVEQGLIKRLPDDWKERWPNVAAVYEKTSIGPKMEEVFGGTYFIPRARFLDNLPGDPLANHPSLYLRKDWAEAVGFPIKSTYTISEVIEFGKLIKEHDPGNVGDRLIPIAENTNHAVELFVARNSTYFDSFYKDEDGTYKWGATHEDTLEGLKLFKEAYDSGVLSPDFYTVTDEQHGDYFLMTGFAGATFFQAPTSALQNNYNTFQTNLGLDPYEHIHMATVLGEDGYYHQRDLINYWGMIIFNPDISDEKFERYMDILEYNATREGYLTTVLGLKGIDWDYDENGNIISLYDQEAEGRPLGGPDGKYPSMGYLLGSVILFDDFAFDDPNSDERLRELSRQLYKERTEISTPETFPKVDWDLFTFDSPSMRRAQFNYATEYANLITMEGDLETNWRNWIESQMSLVQPVLDELNSQLGN